MLLNCEYTVTQEDVTHFCNVSQVNCFEVGTHPSNVPVCCYDSHSQVVIAHISSYSAGTSGISQRGSLLQWR